MDLFLAAHMGDVKSVSGLLADGADVNAKNNDGNTPLHLAAGNGDKEIVGLLLAKGADANAKDTKGITPLHFAVSNLKDANHNEICEVIELLLAKGADVNAHRSGDGASPLDIVSKKGYRGVVELMIAQAEAAVVDNSQPVAFNAAPNEIDPEIFHKASGGDSISMRQLVVTFMRTNDFASALFWHKEVISEALPSDVDKRLERHIRENLHQKFYPNTFADMADAGPEVILNVSLGRRLEEFSGGVIPDYEPSLFLDSVAVAGKPLGSGVYRIAAPPYRAVGLSYGDVVVTTAAYQGKLYIADILRKSGCRTLLAIPDDPLFERGEFVKCLTDVGAVGKINDDNRTIGINIPPHVPLFAVAQVLSDWDWDVAWHYIDPNLKDDMARCVDLPVPMARPFPPENDNWPEWADDLTLLIFCDEKGAAGGRRRSYYPLAQKLGSNEFRITLPDPSDQNGVSIGDIYEAEPQVMGWPLAGRLIRKSGNRTIWLDMPGTRRKSDPLFIALNQLGCVLVACTGEWNGRRICVSIPPEIEMEKILERLQAEKAGGRSIYWRAAVPIMQMSNDTRVKAETFLEAIKKVLQKPDALSRFKGTQNIQFQNEKWSFMLRYDLLIEEGVAEAIALQEAEEQLVRGDNLVLRLVHDARNPNQKWILIK